MELADAELTLLHLTRRARRINEAQQAVIDVRRAEWCALAHGVLAQQLCDARRRDQDDSVPVECDQALVDDAGCDPQQVNRRRRLRIWHRPSIGSTLAQSC